MAETSETRSIFITGLRNAHAMENQALSIIKPQVSRIENYPEVARRLEQHIRETEGQVVRLEEILNGLARTIRR
jgi:ferritin-like metal-binding protein YciE